MIKPQFIQLIYNIFQLLLLTEVEHGEDHVLFFYRDHFDLRLPTSELKEAVSLRCQSC